MKNKQPSWELKEIIETLSMYYEDFLEENATCGGCSYWGMPKVIELSNRLALSSEIHQAVAEERKRVRENLPKIITPTVEPPPNNLSQNQIFASGQMNMLLRVTELLASLDKPLTDNNKRLDTVEKEKE